MDSRDDRDMEQEESEGTFPQMEASGSAGILFIETNLNWWRKYFIPILHPFPFLQLQLCHLEQLNLTPQLDSLSLLQFLNLNKLALHSLRESQVHLFRPGLTLHGAPVN